MFKVITAPTAEAITRAEAKLHLRVDDVGGVHPDDTLIDGLITAARQYAEQHTGCALVQQTLELSLDRFPACGSRAYSDGILLDRPPAASITSIKYTDSDGVEQTIDSGNYALSSYGHSVLVTPAYNYTWPTARAIRDAVRVRYVTGYGATGHSAAGEYATLPKATKNAMLLHIDAHYPGNGYTEQQRAGIMQAVDSLLNTVKVYGF
jgi:uncharacterized phiE125 gp8 family phage protein